MVANQDSYPARLEVDYPDKLNRFTTLVRVLWGIPIVIVMTLLSSSGDINFGNHGGHQATVGGGGITGGLFIATLLLILFRQRYPRWWFNFVLELNRFSYRVGAYMFLLTDQYPSTEDKQTVTLDLDYPDVKQDLNRWLPLVKWLLVLPHFIILVILFIATVLASIIAWFAILFTGRYPRSLFDFVVGVGRWSLRVNAYAFLLVTDEYPPFSLKA